jgi:hypothetical protein
MGHDKRKAKLRGQGGEQVQQAQRIRPAGYGHHHAIIRGEQAVFLAKSGYLLV